MAETVELACPNPACPGREVDDAGVVLRETWESAWLAATREMPGEYRRPECPECDMEGVPADDRPQLEQAEEEHGQRCQECGVVTANPDGGCPHCGEAFPNQKGDADEH